MGQGVARGEETHTVDIGPLGLAICEDLAWLRHAVKKLRSVHQADHRISPNQSNGVDSSTGCQGEYAVCLAMGTQMDWTISLSGDEGFDTVSPGGSTIQVKYRRRGGTYATETQDEHIADLGVLVWPEKASQFTLAGWVSREVWMAERELVEWKYGKRWHIQNDKLYNVGVLLGKDPSWTRAESAMGPLPVSRMQLRQAWLDAMWLVDVRRVEDLGASKVLTLAEVEQLRGLRRASIQV